MTKSTQRGAEAGEATAQASLARVGGEPGGAVADDDGDGDGARAAGRATADACLDEHTDQQLMAAVQADDPGAFDVLFKRYKGPLLAFLHRYTRDVQRAEDVFQQAFLKVYTHRASFQGQASFRTWLYTIAVNGARDLHRHERIRRMASLDAPIGGADDDNDRSIDPEAEGLQPIEHLEASELQDRLSEAIGKLDDDYRAPFVLARLQGLSYQEIAKALQITVPTVRMRVHRANRKLGSLLQSYMNVAEPR